MSNNQKKEEKKDWFVLVILFVAFVLTYYLIGEVFPTLLKLVKLVVTIIIGFILTSFVMSVMDRIKQKRREKEKK